jgi:hypothetical protein
MARKDGSMAGKPKNRLELRRQYEAAEPIDPIEEETAEAVEEAEDEEVERRPKKKAKAPAKPKATKAPKPAARMRIVWAVVNDAFKTVATFDYTQKEAAEARAAELMAKGKGTHFIQKVKEPMADNAPGLGASLPRAEAAPAKAAAGSKTAKAAAPVEEEPDEEEDEDEPEPDMEEEDDEE